MLQCLEWEPSGLFYQTNMDASSDNVTNASQNGTPGSNRVNQDITDPTLAPNPRKAVLYRPSVTHFMAVSIHYLQSFPFGTVNWIWILCSDTMQIPLNLLK